MQGFEGSRDAQRSGGVPMTRRELRRLREQQEQQEQQAQREQHPLQAQLLQEASQSPQFLHDGGQVPSMLAGSQHPDASAGQVPLRRRSRAQQQQGSGVPTILTVCTGNICRSALAEVLLRQRLEKLGVRIHSAGTHALVGKGMPKEAQQLAATHGGEAAVAAGHAGRLLNEHLLAESDLVLAMATEHSTFAVELAPSRLQQTFPVRVFARLAATLSDDELRQAAAAGGNDARARLQLVARRVAQQRGLVRGDGNDDVIDPFRRSWQIYEQSASELVPALDQVVRVVESAVVSRSAFVWPT